jgi:hypothetical protein
VSADRKKNIHCFGKETIYGMAMDETPRRILIPLTSENTIMNGREAVITNAD